MIAAHPYIACLLSGLLGLGLGAVLGMLAFGLCAMARDADEELNDSNEAGA